MDIQNTEAWRRLVRAVRKMKDEGGASGNPWTRNVAYAAEDLIDVSEGRDGYFVRRDE